MESLSGMILCTSEELCYNYDRIQRHACRSVALEEWNRAMIERDTPSVLIRVWTLGAFCVERCLEDGTWKAVSLDEWGGNSHSRRLLKFLLCHERKARRGTIMEELWSRNEFLLAEEYLNKAASNLRRILHAQRYESLLKTTNNRTTYELDDQSHLWVDADACELLMKAAEHAGRTSTQGLAFLQEARNYFERGRFLEDEDGLWCHGKGGLLDTARYRCTLWLAEAYEEQGQLQRAEVYLEKLHQEDPTDEDVLCRLLLLLHKQGMTAEAVRRYKQTQRLLERQGEQLTETTRIFVERLKHESAPISIVISRRQLLQELLAVASFALITPPHELLSTDTLDRLAFVLNKPSSLDVRVLTDLDSITYGIWRARVDGVSSPNLLNGALGHLQVVIQLLKSSHDMRTRRHLYSVARNAGQLVGHLLFDIQDFAMAWSYYNFALSAAQSAHQPDEEAAVLGLMSFVLTYKEHPTKTPPETVTLLEHAQLLSAQSTIYPLRACLSAIKAEIHANLGQIDAYHREIDLAQNFLTYPGDRRDTVPDDMFNFDPAALAGYQGACLLRIGKPLEALTALQESVQDLQMIHALRLVDIGIAHAQLGAYSKACMLGREALTMIAQTKNRSQLQRVHELRRDLEPWKNASEVQELAHLFKTTATLLEEKE